MQLVHREWGGVERAFALDFGLACDLEEACGKVGIGALYVRLATHQHFARDVYHTIRLGLVGGGMPRAEADRLVALRFSEVGWALSVSVAVDLLSAMNEGIVPGPGGGDPATPMDMGKVLANFAQAGIGPDVVRAMRYADFINLMRSLGGKDVAPPTEEEFADMIRRHGEIHNG